MQNDLPKLALLIDVENVSPAMLPSILETLKQTWDPFLRRAYGSDLAPCRKILTDCGISPVQLLRNVKGKSISDQAICIGCMEILHAGRANGICLVSGDSDFTQLVFHVREQNVPILVFGNESTPSALRNACTEFHIIPRQSNNRTRPYIDSDAGVVHKLGKAEIDADHLKDRLHELYREFISINELCTVDIFGGFVRQKIPSFSCKQYSARSISSLLRRLGGFELRGITNNDQIVVNYEVSQTSVN